MAGKAREEYAEGGVGKKSGPRHDSVGRSSIFSLITVLSIFGLNDTTIFKSMLHLYATGISMQTIRYRACKFVQCLRKTEGLVGGRLASKAKGIYIFSARSQRRQGLGAKRR